MPAISWFFLAPYVIYAVLIAGHRFFPDFFAYTTTYPDLTVDIVALCFVLLGVYIAIISLALMATSIASERAAGTWDALAASVFSDHDLLLGFLVGRLGPVLAAFAAVGGTWVAARPHYAPLLQSVSPVTLTGAQIALLVLDLSFISLAIGAVAMAVSVYSRDAGRAVIVSLAASLVIALLCAVPWMIINRPPDGWAIIPLAAVVTVTGYATAVRGVRRSRMSAA